MDEKERYYHIFHSVVKEGKNREKVEDKIEKMTKFLKEREGTKNVPTDAVEDYYERIIDEKGGIFMFAREKQDAEG